MKFFKIKNSSNFDLGNSEDLFHGLGQFAQKRFGFKRPPSLNLVSDQKNAGKPLGKTAYYDPQSMSVTIYTDNRHTKDILRSLAHELVHHTQNENGMLNDSGYHGAGYAQKNKDLRKSEKEAYLKGNMCFRDWEDGLKQEKPTIYNERRIKNMSTKDWKNKELMENLSNKFGFKMNLKKLNEGEIPAGLKAYQDKQKAKKGKDSEEEESDSSEGKKPDFPDIDGDGDRKEPISKAQKDKKKSLKEDEEMEEKPEDDPDPDDPMRLFYAKEKKKKNEEMEEKPNEEESVGEKAKASLMKHSAKKQMKESRIMKIIKQEIRKQLKERK